MQDMILKAKGKDKAIVLVVDYHTAKILSSCLRMYDVMEAGVLVLENVLLTRERLDLPAIYFVQPTPAVIEAIIKDFDSLDPAVKPPQRPAYSASHLFFTSRLPADLMKRLSQSKRTIQRIKTLIELNCDFLALESHVFTFDRKGTVPNLYFPPATNTLSLELSDLSRHLVSLCLTMHEYPYVRYVEGSGLSQGQVLPRGDGHHHQQAARLEVQRAARARHTAHHRPLHGRHCAAHARVHLPGHGQRPAQGARRALLPARGGAGQPSGGSTTGGGDGE